MATTVTDAVTNATNIISNSVTGAINDAQNNADAIESTSFSNVSLTNILDTGVLVEVHSPALPNGGYFYNAGSQTTPGLARGALVNSSLLTNNNDLSHVCDFKFDFSAGISLSGLTNPFTSIANAIRNGKMAGANAVRAAIGQLQQAFRTGLAALLSALNFDPTGQVSLAISAGKALVRQLNAITAQVAQIVYDVTLIQSIVQNLQQIVTWIQSLPSQIQKLLQQCLTNFKTSLNNTNNTIKNASNITQTLNNLVQTATNNSNQQNSSTSSSMMSVINGSTNSSDLSSLTKMINDTVAAAPPTQSAVQATASKP
jgi:hypothetical protein